MTGDTHPSIGVVRPGFDQGFSYDNLDRLLSATVGETTTGYTYEANGNRTARTVGSTIN